MKTITNADEILFRCSSLGKLMTKPKSKDEKISETTKTYLAECFVNAKYGRYKELTNKYIAKGLAVEEDSITLYSRVKKQMFKKNEQRLSNGFITGTPDLFTGESIEKADCIIDIKSSWSIFTFYATTIEKLNSNYYFQLQGYMALTGAKTAKLAYCLIDTPDAIFMQELRTLMYQMGCDAENKLYQEAANKMEELMKYSDIPISERMNEIEIPRNDSDIARIKEQVILCREWMNKNLF